MSSDALNSGGALALAFGYTRAEGMPAEQWAAGLHNPRSPAAFSFDVVVKSSTPAVTTWSFAVTTGSVISTIEAGPIGARDISIASGSTWARGHTVLASDGCRPPGATAGQNVWHNRPRHISAWHPRRRSASRYFGLSASTWNILRSDPVIDSWPPNPPPWKGLQVGWSELPWCRVT
jgi:hypothetical protein